MEEVRWGGRSRFWARGKKKERWDRKGMVDKELCTTIIGI